MSFIVALLIAYDFVYTTIEQKIGSVILVSSLAVLNMKLLLYHRAMHMPASHVNVNDRAASSSSAVVMFLPV
jgi:hypothetical protein